MYVALLVSALVACTTPSDYRPDRPLDTDRFPLSCEGDFDQAPVLVAGNTPVFPISMLNPHVIEDRRIRRLPLEWWVTAAFTVEADGTTSGIEASPTSPQSFSDHMAIAVKSWRFTPASGHGVAVASRCSAKFGYSLR